MNFDIKPDPKCKNCGRDKGRHLAKDLNCPFGRGNFPQFFIDQFYEPRKTRAKKEAK